MKIKIGGFVCILMLFVTPILLAEDAKKEIRAEPDIPPLQHIPTFENPKNL